MNFTYIRARSSDLQKSMDQPVQVSVGRSVWGINEYLKSVHQKLPRLILVIVYPFPLTDEQTHSE